MFTESKSLRRLTHIFLISGRLPTKHSLLQVKTMMITLRSPWAEKNPVPAFLSSCHLWYFSWLTFSNLQLGGNYKQMEKQNLIGGDEMKEKCLCPQFYDCDHISHPKLYHSDQKTTQIPIVDTTVRKSRKGGWKRKAKLKSTILKKGRELMKTC